MTMSVSAEATVVYSGPIGATFGFFAPTSPLYLDIDGAGVVPGFSTGVDFYFNGPPLSFTGFGAAPGASMLLAAPFAFAALPAGATISSLAAPFGTAGSALAIYGWVPSAPAFLGVNFVNTSGVHNGWIQVHMDGAGPAVHILVDYAYETGPGPISAGAIPEPSGLTLLAMGAVGLGLYRQTRRPRNQSPS